MKRCALLLGLMVFVGLPAHAQGNYPKTEIFLGYSYSPHGSGAIAREVAHGWSVSLSGNFIRYFGITTDIGSEYGDVDALGVSFRNYHFLTGPRFTVRTNRVTVFVHALYGVALTKRPSYIVGFITVPSSLETDPAMSYGAGLDVNLIPFLALRLAQFDHVLVRVNGTWQDNNRLRAGIVFKF